MENELSMLPNRIIAVFLLIIPISCLLSLVVMSAILPSMEWPPSLPSIVASLVGPIVIVGFMIYGANFRDERSVHISDKASRNGFMFVLYVTPILLVILSVTGASVETMLALLTMCLGMIAVACISAAYYYHK